MTTGAASTIGNVPGRGLSLRPGEPWKLHRDPEHGWWADCDGIFIAQPASPRDAYRLVICDCCGQELAVPSTPAATQETMSI